jgi:hypothetical protein
MFLQEVGDLAADKKAGKELKPRDIIPPQSTVDKPSAARLGQQFHIVRPHLWRAECGSGLPNMSS